MPLTADTFPIASDGTHIIDSTISVDGDGNIVVANGIIIAGADSLNARLQGGEDVGGSGNSVLLGGTDAGGGAGSARVIGGSSVTTAIAGGSVDILGGSAAVGDADGGDIVMTPGSAHGSGVAGHIRIVALEEFTDDAAAATGGVPVNGLYRTASAVKVRVS